MAARQPKLLTPNEVEPTESLPQPQAPLPSKIYQSSKNLHSPPTAVSSDEGGGNNNLVANVHFQKHDNEPIDVPVRFRRHLSALSPVEAPIRVTLDNSTRNVAPIQLQFSDVPPLRIEVVPVVNTAENLGAGNNNVQFMDEIRNIVNNATRDRWRELFSSQYPENQNLIKRAAAASAITREDCAIDDDGDDAWFFITITEKYTKISHALALLLIFSVFLLWYLIACVLDWNSRRNHHRRSQSLSHYESGICVEQPYKTCTARRSNTATTQTRYRWTWPWCWSRQTITAKVYGSSKCKPKNSSSSSSSSSSPSPASSTENLRTATLPPCDKKQRKSKESNKRRSSKDNTLTDHCRERVNIVHQNDGSTRVIVPGPKSPDCPAGKYFELEVMPRSSSSETLKPAAYQNPYPQLPPGQSGSEPRPYLPGHNNGDFMNSSATLNSANELIPPVMPNLLLNYTPNNCGGSSNSSNGGTPNNGNVIVTTVTTHTAPATAASSLGGGGSSCTNLNPSPAQSPAAGLFFEPEVLVPQRLSRQRTWSNGSGHSCRSSECGRRQTYNVDTGHSIGSYDDDIPPGHHYPYRQDVSNSSRGSHKQYHHRQNHQPQPTNRMMTPGMGDGSYKVFQHQQSPMDSSIASNESIWTPPQMPSAPWQNTGAGGADVPPPYHNV